MSENKSRREFISQSGKMVTACALFGATGSVAYAADSVKATCETGKPMNITAKHYYLDNVLLEAGFNYDGDKHPHRAENAGDQRRENRRPAR